MSVAEQSNYYSMRPPSAFLALQLSPTALPDYPFDGHGEPVQAVFAIRCRCGGEQFSLYGYADEEDEGWICDPVLAACETCATRNSVFDMRSQGYDGALGHNGWKTAPAGEPVLITSSELGPGPCELIVRFEYPSDLLGSEDFPDWRGKEQDLFSWITIVGKRTDKLETLFDAECA